MGLMQKSGMELKCKQCKDCVYMFERFLKIGNKKLDKTDGMCIIKDKTYVMYTSKACSEFVNCSIYPELKKHNYRKK